MTDNKIINFVQNLSHKTATRQLQWQHINILEMPISKYFQYFDTSKCYICNLEIGEIYLINGQLKNSNSVNKNYIFLCKNNIAEQLCVDDCYIYQLLNAIQASSAVINNLIDLFNKEINTK